jgi:hypothetical protein
VNGRPRRAKKRAKKRYREDVEDLTGGSGQWKSFGGTSSSPGERVCTEKSFAHSSGPT